MSESQTKGEGTGTASAEAASESLRALATVDSGPEARGGKVVHTIGTGAVVGRYVVLEKLGAGAMGVVLAAFDPDLDRKIALKLLPPQQGGGNRERREERLVREAKAIAKLSHPNIVGIFDVGVHNDQVFLAMEHLGGGTLRQWLGAGKHSWREILAVLINAGRGLEAAHAENLIHRDFKPENVLLDKNGVAKVADFGLVRLQEALKSPAHAVLDGSEDADLAGSLAGIDLSPATLTRTGALMGTPAYMAPEQFLARPIDARTDQFSFCATLYEALYGERPFPGDNVVDLAKAVTGGQLASPSASSPVPGWLRKVVLRGLATDPAQRYASMGDLLQTLSRDPVARRRKLLAIAAGVVIATAVATTVGRRIENRRVEFEQRIANRIAEGDQAFLEARALADRLKALRARAFTLFDTRDREGGERVWADARAASESLDATLDRAERALAAALDMDSSRGETRNRLADVLFERAELAEREFRREDVARHVAALEVVDTSDRQLGRWRQPGTLSLKTEPSGARLSLERFETKGGDRLTAVAITSELSSPIVDQPLDPGSYRLHIEMRGRADTFYPFVIKRGEKLTADIPLPLSAEIPPGSRYVPAGRFLYGDQDEEWRLSFLNAVPLHERESSAFIINTHETTFGDWIAFLESLPPKERAARLPFSKASQGTVALTEVSNGKWKLLLDISKRPLEATVGQPIAYPGRPAESAKQDWVKMPVLGVSAHDIRAFLVWQSATGKLPGARLCREVEWERAARGADGRAYPTSLRRLAVADVNVDATYGRVSGAYGPDEVGRHPRGASPFGVEDMAGNAWEIVESDDVLGGVLERGGGYYHQPHNARLTNREPIEVETRNHNLGFRVCADARSP